MTFVPFKADAEAFSIRPQLKHTLLPFHILKLFSALRSCVNGLIEVEILFEVEILPLFKSCSCFFLITTTTEAVTEIFSHKDCS